MNISVLTSRILLMLICAACSLDAAADGILSVAGVQLEISPALYRDEENFTDHAADLIERILAEGNVDLVVFPEYTGVFFSFFGLGIEKLKGRDLADGLTFLEKRFGTRSLKEFFLLYPAEDAMDRIWGRLSRRFGISILGGTCFAAEDGISGRELRNRVVLYDRHGKAVYRQDKVYLTSFERDIIGVEPGSLRDVRPVSLQGRKLGISICRDTFFSSWEDKFADVDLWIDIKANGEIFDSRQQRIFTRALPERLLNLPDALGMTVCLNGNFLDLLWEGPSSVICVERSYGDRRISYLDRAESVREESFIQAAVP